MLRTTIVALLCTPLVADEPAGPAAFELRDGDRVVFLGNTLIERMARYGYVEAALTAHWPDRDVTFRNLGWSGDTVWAESRGLFDPPAKGYARMIEHVGRLKPTALFLAYGNVESHGGEAGRAAFVKQYGKLLDDLARAAAADARFVLAGPLPMESVAPEGIDVAAHNERVRDYAAAVRKLSGERGHRYLDLATYVQGGNAIRATGADVRALTSDGRQFTEFGYRQLATELTQQLGWHSGDNLVVTTFAKGALKHAHGARVTNVESTEGGLRFDLEPKHLVTEWITTVEGAKDDSLALRSGERTYAADWGLPGQGTFSLPDSPVTADFDALRAAIIEKNRLYFQRWRPQNVTYIELFRKHEQGRFAKDAAVYDRLVAEKEAEIAKLRRPTKRTYELVPVE